MEIVPLPLHCDCVPRLIRTVTVLTIDVCHGFICLHWMHTKSRYSTFLNLAAMIILQIWFHLKDFLLLYFLIMIRWIK